MNAALLPFTSCEAPVPLQASNLRMKTALSKALVRADGIRGGYRFLWFHGRGPVSFEVIL